MLVRPSDTVPASSVRCNHQRLPMIFKPDQEGCLIAFHEAPLVQRDVIPSDRWGMLRWSTSRSCTGSVVAGSGLRLTRDKYGW